MSNLQHIAWTLTDAEFELTSPERRALGAQVIAVSQALSAVSETEEGHQTLTNESIRIIRALGESCLITELLRQATDLETRSSLLATQLRNIQQEANA